MATVRFCGARRRKLRPQPADWRAALSLRRASANCARKLNCGADKRKIRLITVLESQQRQLLPVLLLALLLLPVLLLLLGWQRASAAGAQLVLRWRWLRER